MQLVPAALVVASWCEGAPELAVVVTSRERLGIDGEVVVDLGPLPCPEEGASHEAILASDAVRLLTSRLRAAGADLPADAGVLGALARRLEGVPLAIELAAARARVLAVTELLARLAQGTALLARRPIGESDRHATLASAIAWSWQLLSGDEQRALAACSVFVADFGVDAAEAVLGAGALDLVAALRDRSLLHAPADGRLALYASIREFARAELVGLGPASESAVRLRHARHYAERARGFAESRTFQGGPDAALRARLQQDSPNLRAALAHARTCGDAAMLGELALGLTLLQAAPADECIEALGASIAALAVGEVDLRARILLSRQSLLVSVGRFDESTRDLEDLLAMPLPPPMRNLALVMRGNQLRYRGLTREAREAHDGASAALEADGPRRLLAIHLACLGRLGHELGDEAAARLHNARARAVAAEMGDTWLEGLPLANLAQLEQELGRFELAARLLDEALARFEATSEPQYEAAYEIAYGNLLFEQGRAGEARARYDAAARFFRGWLAHRQSVQLYTSLAALEARYGALDEAETHLERARRSSPRSPSALVDLLLEVARAQLEVARDPRTRASWTTRLAELEAGEVAETSFEARFALRLLGRALGTSAPSAPPAAGPATRAPRAHVTVARDGRWFVSGGRTVDLGRRGSLKRILAAITGADGASVSRDALLAEGWPGERVIPEAASKRLRVAIATLRSLGLREVIVTTEDGYGVHPAAEVLVREDFNPP